MEPETNAKEDFKLKKSLFSIKENHNSGDNNNDVRSGDFRDTCRTDLRRSTVMEKRRLFEKRERMAGYENIHDLLKHQDIDENTKKLNAKQLFMGLSDTSDTD